MPFGMSILYLLAGPYFTLASFVWRIFLHRLITIIILVFSSIILMFPTAYIVRTTVKISKAVVDFSNRLWDENVHIEERLATRTRQNNQSTRSGIEQLLMRITYIPLLKKGKLARTYNILGLGSAIPTVLAAIAQDQNQKDTGVRRAAIDLLGEEGYVAELLVIAKDAQRQGEIVCQAAEALEMRLEWQPRAAEVWRYLLEHQEASVRLLAADHLKFSANPASRRQAIACLRTLLYNEVVRLPDRIDAGAALGRIGQLGEADARLLVEWMNDAPNPADRLRSAFSLACLGNQTNALSKLRRYCYEYQHGDALRLQAIEYLGRLDRTNDLHPLSRMTWEPAEHRQRAAEIMYENGHRADAAKSWLELALDAKTPAPQRQKALQKTVNTAISSGDPAITRTLIEALPRLGSEGEASRPVRLEAGRAMVKLGLTDQARQIFLVLSRDNNPEAAVRRQATRELRNLALQT